MDSHYHSSRSESYFSTKFIKHSHSDGDFRVLLANFILNFETRDLYSVFLLVLVVFMSFKIFKFAIRFIVSMVRPLFFLSIVLIVLPYLYEMKTGLSSQYAKSDGFFRYISEFVGSIYKQVTSFYARNWLNHT